MKPSPFYQESERLILRSPIESDAPCLATARSTAFVMRYNLYRPCDAEQIREEWEQYEHIVLVRRSDDAVVGCISIRDDETRYHMDSKMLQAWLIEELAYQGYMAEALRVVLRELFRKREHERIALQILSENQASLRLAEKLGFEREGYLKRALRTPEGNVFDVVLLSLDREDYKRRIENE